MFGPEDVLFPKATVKPVKGKGFTNLGLARKGYSNAAKLNTISKGAFAAVQMPQFTPHVFRKTLTEPGDVLCQNWTQRKAWSLNLGPENEATTVNSYLPMTTQGQLDTIRKMAGQGGPSNLPARA